MPWFCNFGASQCQCHCRLCSFCRFDISLDFLPLFIWTPLSLQCDNTFPRDNFLFLYFLFLSSWVSHFSSLNFLSFFSFLFFWTCVPICWFFVEYCSFVKNFIKLLLVKYPLLCKFVCVGLCCLSANGEWKSSQYSSLCNCSLGS